MSESVEFKQENNFELFELYPPLGFRPILKKSFYRSEIFPVHIVGLNINGLKHFYRANGMLNGESFSYGLSYKVNLKKKQRYYLDLMKEALEENNVEYKSFTMSRLGHTFGREEDMRAHFPVIKDFLFE